MAAETVKLKDRNSGNQVWLTVRDGVVVGCMGSDPKRYVGLTIEMAKHHARHGGDVKKVLSKYEKSRLATLELRPQVLPEFLPLFDHCVNLAADAHRRGSAARAGLDLLHARRLLRHGSR